KVARPKITKGPAAKNAERIEAFWVNQTRRFHFRWFQGDPTTKSCSKFVAKKNFPISSHDRDFLGQNNSPRVQPILVGPFLFDRYWMDLELKKNRGVLADPKKMQRFFKVALSKMSNFGPLLLVADWSAGVETMLPLKPPTETTTYPNGVEIEVLLRKL
ncbi:MAG: hypothetical protein GY821_06680, partial [Gammaproteobacteria bacterium]|nr:hypothetical protein [Gammaproteobacteria bacterium]